MRVYDLAMTHQLDADDFFIHRVQQHCAERGLTFFLIEPLWVETFHDYMLSQSASPQMGVPDELVAAVARRLVEGVHGLIGCSR
jgi:hypothetical protein